MEEVNKKKKSNRVVIVLNDEEYENFLKNKKIECKKRSHLNTDSRNT